MRIRDMWSMLFSVKFGLVPVVWGGTVGQDGSIQMAGLFFDCICFQDLFCRQS